MRYSLSTLLLFLTVALTPGWPGAAVRRDVQQTAQPTATPKKNTTPTPTPKLSAYALVIRLLFGEQAKGKEFLKVLNMGETPRADKFAAFRYERHSQKVFPLDTPAGARSILLRVAQREALYLVEGELHRAPLSDALAVAAGAPVLLPRTMKFRSLLGATKSNEILAISEELELVRLALPAGAITVEARLTEEQSATLSAQSLTADGAIASVNGRGKLLLFPRGAQDKGGVEIGEAGFKFDPRWSDDGKQLVFVRQLQP